MNITLIVTTAILSLSITVFIRTLIGFYGTRWSSNAIFSKYIFFLSKKVLQKNGVYNEIADNFGSVSDLAAKRLFWRIAYERAEDYFTWQSPLGVCLYCTNIWISIIVGVLITGEHFYYTVFISNLLISIYSKWQQ